MQQERADHILLRDVDGYIPRQIDYEFFRNRKFFLTSQLFHDDGIFEEIRKQKIADALAETPDNEHGEQVAGKVDGERYVLISHNDDQGIMSELKAYLLHEGINVKMLESSASVAVEKIYDAAVFLCPVTEHYDVIPESYEDIFYAFYKRVPITPLILLRRRGRGTTHAIYGAWRKPFDLRDRNSHKYRFPYVLEEVRSLLEPSVINRRSIPWNPTARIIKMKGKKPVVKYDEVEDGVPRILLCSIVEGDIDIVVQLKEYLSSKSWNVSILEQSEDINVEAINDATIFVVPVSKKCSVESARVRDIQYAYRRRVPLLPVVMAPLERFDVTPARGFQFVKNLKPIDLTTSDFPKKFPKVASAIEAILSKWVMQTR